MQRPDEKYVIRQEKRMRGRMRAIWKEQMAHILRSARDLYPAENIYLKNELDSRARTIIDIIIDTIPGVDKTGDAIVYYQGAMYTRQGRKLIKELGLDAFGVTFDSVNQLSVKRLSARRTFELSQRNGTITHTTKIAIKDILLKGIQSGDSYTVLSEKIQAQAQAGVFSQARGELIATTEIGRAYGEGNFDVMEAFKEKNQDYQPVKKWVTVSDDRVREDHTANEDEGWIPMEQIHSGTDEMFAPSADFRCRCFERYSIDISLTTNKVKVEAQVVEQSQPEPIAPTIIKETKIIREQVDETALIHKTAEQVMARLDIAEGDRGPMGFRGERGERGIAGRDGNDGKDGLNGDKGARGEQGIAGNQGTRGEQGDTGQDGKDGSPDTPAQVRDKLQSLKGEQRLDKSAIKGLDALEKRNAPIFSSGKSTFKELTDTPRKYDGEAGKYVRVKTDEKGLEYVADDKATVAQLNTHIGDTTNPHQVTLAQVGGQPPTIVDTKANILAMTATAGLVAYATDTETNFFADGVGWNEELLSRKATAEISRPIEFQNTAIVTPSAGNMRMYLETTAGSVSGNLVKHMLRIENGDDAILASFDNRVESAPANVLDLITPTSVAGYSLRKLRDAYAGSAVRVRRSSDNAEQDIGFSGEDFDTSAFSTFVGAGSGFVTTWYDQSTSGFNTTQTTVGNQPRIVLNVTNGKPVLRFDGTNDFLTGGNVLDIGAGDQTILGIMATTQTTIWRLVQKRGTGSTTSVFGWQISFSGNSPVNIFYCFDSGSFAQVPTGISNINNGSFHSLSTSFSNSGEAVKVYIDGVHTFTSALTGTIAGKSVVTTRHFTIGAAWNDVADQTQWLNGDVPELIIYPTALSDLDREAIEGNQGTYFGVTIL